MVKGENGGLAFDAAGTAYADRDADDNTQAIANGLAAIAYALLHLADVIQDGQDN